MADDGFPLLGSDLAGIREIDLVMAAGVGEIVDIAVFSEIPIHQRDGCDLAAGRLGTLTVGEVSGGVTDTERIVCGSIACTEARTAECSF